MSASREDRLRAGDRRALARAITLVESTRPDHRAEAERLVDALTPTAGDALRLGISGAPGVGKSTLIEALGNHIVDRGLRVAVLAIDPSSAVSGGAILGDKTRMATLASRPEAFIRPSPAGTTLGGAARRTREAIILCEAYGADVVIVESVGVGQSEVAVASMTDLFLLLVGPGAGDDLQGIKRGVMELADLVCITKADGDLAAAARRAVADHRAALGLMARRDGDPVPVMSVSALTGDGVDDLWQSLTREYEQRRAQGKVERRRAAQRVQWMWAEVREGLIDRAAAAGLDDIEQRVAAGTISPTQAATAIVARITAPSEHP